MKKLQSRRLAAAIAATIAPLLPHGVSAAQSDFTFKVNALTEYEYRGLAQTSEDPALQLEANYRHRSGFYVGALASNSSWLEDYQDDGLIDDSASVELRFGAGYRAELAGGVQIGLGYLRYDYPGSHSYPGIPDPRTQEIVADVAWKGATLRYSYSIDEAFGVPESDGTDFVELEYRHALLGKLGIDLSAGYQRYRGSFDLSPTERFDNDRLSYSVYKLGLNYELGHGFAVAATYKHTDAESSLYTVNGIDFGRDRVIGNISWVF